MANLRRPWATVSASSRSSSARRTRTLHCSSSGSLRGSHESHKASIRTSRIFAIASARHGHAMTQMVRPPQYGPVTRYAPRRRRRIRWALAVAITLVATASVVIVEYPSTNGWPRDGQGAYQVGDAAPAASPNEQPVPIASLAKLMTAYLVVQHFPLNGGGGPRFRVTTADVKDTEERRQSDQSLIDVRAGEWLTERQELAAMLLPSANNIAVLVARQVDGSVASYVDEMNE